MIDSLYALVPIYGPWIIIGSVLLSCFALPIPSSLLVMIAGGFAAVGDFSYFQVALSAYFGFILGDQLVYLLASWIGKNLINSLQAHRKAARLVDKAKVLVDKHGGLSVFLSRTLFSPLGPWVGYVSGALGMPWRVFTLSAVSGAFVWSVGYSYLGYVFAANIVELSAIISSTMGFVLAGAIASGSLAWMLRSYRKHQKRAIATQENRNNNT